MRYMLRLARIFDTVSVLAMYALFALLPVFFLPFEAVTLPQAKMLAVTVLLFISVTAWVIASLLRGGLRVPRTAVLLIALLFPLAYGISIFISDGTLASIWGSGIEQDTLVAVCLWYVALFGAAVLFSDTVVRGVHAIRALFAGSFVLLLVQCIHLVFPTAFSLDGVLASPTANLLGGWYELGIFAGLMIFMGIASLRTPVASRYWRFLILAVTILAFIVLLIINPREVWIALAAIALLYMVLDLIGRGHWYELLHAQTWQRHAVWILLIIASVSLFFANGALNARLPARLQLTVTEVRPSWRGTFEIGSQSLSDTSRIVFGAGPNTFGREWRLYKPFEVNQTDFWNTDFVSGVGFIPTTIITIGVFGGVVWALLILSIVWLCLRLASVSPRQGASLVLEPIFLGVLFLIAFHVVYVPGPALSILTFLLLGLGIGYAASMNRIPHLLLTSQKRGVASAPYFIALLLLMTGTLLSSFGIGHVVAAEILVNQSIVTYNTTGDLPRSSGFVSSALRIYPQHTRSQRAAVELGLLQLQKITESGTTEQSSERIRKTIEDTIRYALMAVSINSNEYQNWLELATLYQQLAGVNIDGAYEQAQTAYARLIEENPRNPIPYFQRAQLELLENKTDAALADLLTAVQIKPDFAVAYYLASQVYAAQGEYQAAITPAVSAAQLVPNDPTAWYNVGAIAYTAGAYQEAIAPLEKAVSLESSYANGLYVLGLSYARVGRLDDARRIFIRLNTVDPDQPIVKEIMGKLDTGESLFSEMPTSAATSLPVRR